GQPETSRADLRDCSSRAAFHELRNAGDAYFPASGHLSGPLFARPGDGKSGADSRGHDHGCGMAGLGYTRAKDPRLRTWSSHGNVGLSALSNPSQLWRALLLWTVRLVIYPPKVPLPIQRSHFRRRQSCFLPAFTVATANISR